MSEPKLVKSGADVAVRIGNPTNYLTQNGGDVKPVIPNPTGNQAQENGAGAAPSSAVKRGNGTFDGPASSPKRGRPASSTQKR